MRSTSPPAAPPRRARPRRRRAAFLFIAASFAAALAGAGTLGPGESIVPSSQQARFNKGADVIVDTPFGDIPAVFVGHYFLSPSGERIAIVYNELLGTGHIPMDWLLPPGAARGATTREAAPATTDGSSDALSAATLPNGKTVVVGWARGAANGFGASGFVSLVRANLTPDPTFNGTGFALVEVGATTFFNDVVVTPHGIIAAGFGTNEAGTDSRLLFARFGLNGKKTGQLVVNVGPSTDQVAELAYNRLRDIVYFVGSTAQADTFADGLVGVLNPKTMKLATSFGGGDGMAQVNNPSGHAFFTSAELVANGLAACGVFGSQGMCHSFNYLGQTGALWGPNGCLRSGAAFTGRCDTDPAGNIYCAAAGGGGTCLVCKIDPGCTGAGFGPNGCQPWFPGYTGACAARAVGLGEPKQPKGFAATDGVIAEARLIPNPSALEMDFNELVAVGQVIVGNLSQSAYAVQPAFPADKSPCAQGSLCLSGNRFEVTAFNSSGGPITPATAAALTADTGYFTFLNPNNVEVVTKVVNACGLGRFWVFAAGLTNQGVGIRVRDTKTGVIKEYINPIGRAFPPLQDTDAFATCPIVAGEGFEPILSFDDESAAAEAADAAMEPPSEPSLEAALADITERESAALAAELEGLAAAGRAGAVDPALLTHLGAPINLRNNRFKVEATFKTPTGPTTPATGVLITDETAYFRFLNPANVEVIVKIVNACGSGTPRYWVFAAGLTNVRVDITITDTKTGAKKVYTNNQGVPFKPIQDVNAFATCP